ncbi:hypothetical protein NQ176_g5112 [Zarea fungicola]|uniref:Uncharacterized protein n=1 Tax=Zarea fungicola TaxID=93591 RepID=A0ACC1NA44_9HYPO|nr:hypothetical protein NQ176_g5112 [Lecanicillium fungicola]
MDPNRGRGGPYMAGLPAGPASGGASPPRGRGPAPGPPISNARGRGRGGPYGGGPPGGRRPPPPQHPTQSQYNQHNEAYMTEGMAAMNIDGQNNRGSFENQGYQGNYSQAMGHVRRPPPRQQSRGFSENGQGYSAPMNARAPPPRRGFPENTQAGPGYGEYDTAPVPRRQGPPAHGFGPPGRSMTMPVDDPARQSVVSHQRAETMPHNGPAGTVGPPRPATTTGTRPTPQRTYPQDQPMSPTAPYGAAYDTSFSNASAGSTSEIINDYYDLRHSNPGQTTGGTVDMNAPQNGTRHSYDQPAAQQTEQSHRGPNQIPRLGHAKSMAEMREPQSAVFEMSIAQVTIKAMIRNSAKAIITATAKPYLVGKCLPEDLALHPLLDTAHTPPDFRAGSGLSSATQMPQRSSPESLPSHPPPVRPGQMANSLVNPSGKPPPVRNYSGVSQQSYRPQQYSQQDLPSQQERQYAEPPVPTNASRDMAQEKGIDAPVTTQELEQLRMIIKSNPADQRSALRLARRLIEAADALVSQIMDPRARSKARDRYLVDAHKILKKLASNQNSDAMFTLADGLGKGLFGGEPDTKEAFTLYQSAAKLGHAAAAYRTAVCCEIGNDEGGGTRRDPLKAIQWYKRAATLGDTPAMYKMGMVTLKGLLGQSKSPREAVSWLKRAAERADAENPHALHELGLLYQSAQPDDYIIRDEGYALSLFQQAADLGYKFSQFRLGCAYEYGLLGCPIDARLSIVWYSKAAMQEEHQAELALSGWYLTGSEGVLNQSDTEAYLWARKAATAGMAKAEFAMGYFTEVGIGVPPNLEDAKRWYWRAAAQDFPQARERLEELKRAGKTGPPRPRERISRSRIERQQDVQSHICWSKGVAVSVGGPMATAWVVPSEEELRSRYNPDLLKRSLEGREERQAEFNEFVTKLKAYSKSDKPSGFIFIFNPNYASHGIMDEF